MNLTRESLSPAKLSGLFRKNSGWRWVRSKWGSASCINFSARPTAHDL